MIVVGAVIPVPPTEAGGLPLDKAVHLCEYLLFAWCLARAGGASRWSAGKIRVTTLLIAIGLGTTLEGIQAWLPWRSAELADAVANACGALLGVWLANQSIVHSR